MGDEENEGIEGVEGVQGVEGFDVAAMYIVIWFGHHGNRLYGYMGLRSKMSDWMDGWVSGVDRLL